MSLGIIKSHNLLKLDSQIKFRGNISPETTKQLGMDLTIRARGGIFIYLSVWLITAIWSDMAQHEPLFFYVNTIILSVIFVMRIIHYMLFTFKNLNSPQMYNWLILLILIGALHWGVMSAWIIFGSKYQSLHYPYMIILSAFAIGGSSILSISFSIRVLYPLFIFIPTFIAGVTIGGSENYVLAILLVFALLYIFEASRVSSKDYWNALYNRKEAEDRAKEMEKLSVTDQLTGLNNRMYFNQHFSNEWKRCSRLKLSLSLMLVDLDHFKLINDNYGHLAGDECLKKVSTVMKSQIKRDTDIVARYGGEEFIIILPDTSLDESTKVAQELLRNIAGIELTWEEKIIRVTCSIGLISIVPEQHLDRKLLLKASDNAMYQAKTQGRNQFCIYQGLLDASPTNSEVG